MIAYSEALTAIQKTDFRCLEKAYEEEFGAKRARKSSTGRLFHVVGPTTEKTRHRVFEVLAKQTIHSIVHLKMQNEDMGGQTYRAMQHTPLPPQETMNTSVCIYVCVYQWHTHICSYMYASIYTRMYIYNYTYVCIDCILCTYVHV